MHIHEFEVNSSHSGQEAAISMGDLIEKRDTFAFCLGGVITDKHI